MSSVWFCVLGPTALGKTDLACELVQLFPCEIISIDSAMIYRDMNIGSAKPDASVLLQAPHHLIDILSPEQSYSVAHCVADVQRCAAAIEARGKIPLLVGGTMLYFRALQQGLSTLPTADLKIRHTLLSQAHAHGWEHLYQTLMQVDPQAANRIHPHDTQRIIRALEVFAITQQPLSTWQQISQPTITQKFVNLILMPEDRSWLHARIAQRFHAIVDGGLIDEVMQLRQRYHLTAANPSMRCVGYRQVWEYLEDQHDLSHLLEKGIAATRQLAKRQLTWLRHWPNGRIFLMNESRDFQEIVAFMRQIPHN